MKALLIYLPAIACLVMALVICLPMLLERGKSQPDSEVAELKEEVARLRAQVASDGHKHLSTFDG